MTYTFVSFPSSDTFFVKQVSLTSHLLRYSFIGKHSEDFTKIHSLTISRLFGYFLKDKDMPRVSLDSFHLPGFLCPSCWWCVSRKGSRRLESRWSVRVGWRSWNERGLTALNSEPKIWLTKKSNTAPVVIREEEWYDYFFATQTLSVCKQNITRFPVRHVFVMFSDWSRNFHSSIASLTARYIPW